MNKLIVIFTGCVVFTLMTLSCIAAAPATAGSPVPATPKGTEQTKWEYLVISFGKTYFVNPNESPETKTAGLSKLLSYSKAGIVNAQEALSTQSQMDSLGKFGWELVGIIGSIGGDQQIVFKRVYNLEQSKKEAELIRQEGERLLALQREEIAKITNVPANELVDLDAVEKAAATEETRRKEEGRLKEAIASVKDYNITDIKVNSLAGSPDASALTANITVDGTAALLKDGNKYRLSEAGKIAKAVANAIYTAAGLKLEYGISSTSTGYYLGEVKISVSVKIAFGDTSKIVTVENVGGTWAERARK